MSGDTTVVSLYGAMPAVGVPVPDVVELCEKLLDRAKAGRVVGVGVFSVEAANVLYTGYASGTADAHLMVAAAVKLHNTVIKSWCEE